MLYVWTTKTKECVYFFMTSSKQTGFSDEDLKRLATYLVSYDSRSGRKFSVDMKLEALLARLEAAEQCKDSLLDVLNHGLQYESGEVHQADTEKAKASIEAWLRSAGKEG